MTRLKERKVESLKNRETFFQLANSSSEKAQEFLIIPHELCPKYIAKLLSIYSD